MSEAEREERNDKQEAQQTIHDPMAQLRELCSGTFDLTTPIRAGGQEIAELRYDFCALTGEELLDALDREGGGNMFAITNKQAMSLFCQTAANCTELLAEDGGKRHLFPGDIRKAISSVDAVRAVQIAKLFYNASSRASRATNRRISKG